MKALKKIYDFNVMKFQNGEMGAVNGMAADGQVMVSSKPASAGSLDRHNFQRGCA